MRGTRTRLLLLRVVAVGVDAADAADAALLQQQLMKPTPMPHGVDQADDGAAGGGRGGSNNVIDGGGLTPLVYAARANDVESVKILLEAGADINQVTGLRLEPATRRRRGIAIQARRVSARSRRGCESRQQGRLGHRCICTDDRNIESRDYPVRRADMDHLDFIKILLDRGART